MRISLSRARHAGRRARWRGWLGEALRRALPGYCAFCHTGISGCASWCADCHADMPWNLTACAGCAEPLPGGGEPERRCGRCLRRPPIWDDVWAPLRYEGRVQRLVQRFKFAASPRAGDVLVTLMVSSLARDAPLPGGWPDALIGVPGQPLRTRERGFDHTAWLTRRLAARLDRPCLTAVRLRDTVSQRGLDRRARRRNVAGAFHVPTRLPRSVMVVDDVMTTGATLDALARACREAGAEHVSALAFARTPAGRI